MYDSLRNFGILIADVVFMDLNSFAFRLGIKLLKNPKICMPQREEDTVSGLGAWIDLYLESLLVVQRRNVSITGSY